MSSFVVSNGDSMLIAEWDSVANEFGDLILNNTTKKTYNTMHLNKASFAKHKAELPVINGDIYSIRLLTKAGRNQTVANKSGRTTPAPLKIVLESRNRQLAVRLLNYHAVEHETNGYDPITEFDVLIDNGDNVDDLQRFLIANIVNGCLVITNVAGQPLENGRQYEVVARAVNETGAGEFSAPVSEAPSEKPAMVEEFVAVEKDTMVTLTWKVSQENIRYEISKRVSGQQSWEGPISLTKTHSEDVVDASNIVVGTRQVNTTEHTFKELVNGTPYDFKIVAVSVSFGPSVENILNGKIPFGLPAYMNDNVIITDLSNNSIQVRLTPPYGNGRPITGYRMYLTTDVSSNLAAGPVDASYNIQFVVSNLAAGAEQKFSVSAMNSPALNTNALSVSYRQYSNPNPVVSLAALNTTVSQSEVGQVNLSWDLSGNMGGAEASDFNHVIKYSSSYDVDDSNVRIERSQPAGSAKQLLISNLVVGRLYDFTVQSEFFKNGVTFKSARSSAVSIKPYSKPAAPAPLTFEMDEANKVNIKFTWNQPKLFGLPLKHYLWKVVPVSNLTPANVPYYETNALEMSVLPTTYGVAYKLYMKTVTTLSNSEDLTSDEFVSEEFIPYKAPSAVQNLTLYPLDKKVEVRWDRPDINGGYSDIRYNVAINGVFHKTVSSKYTRLENLPNEQVYISVVSAGYFENDRQLAGPAVVKSTYPYNDPEPPSELSLTPGDRTVDLSWTASTTAVNVGLNDVEAPVISYIIFRDDVKIDEVSNGVVIYRDSSRANGQLYGYRVVTKQTFEDGKSTYSDSFSESQLCATPFKNPEPPQNLNLSVTDKTINVSWTKETSLNGLVGPAKYRVIVTDASNVEVNDSNTSSLSAIIGGLTNNATYTVSVYTLAENTEDNVKGWYESSTALSGSAKPNPTPSAPRNLVATSGHQQISLTWNLVGVSDNYVTDSFKVYKNNVFVSDLSADVLSYNFENLTNGTSYSVAVRRITTSGEVSDIVPLSNQVPAGVPLLVSVATAQEGKQISVTFDPNGAVLTDFIVFVATDGYAAGDVLIHKASPIKNELVLKGSVNKITEQLNVSTRIIGAYVIVVNAAGKVLVHQQSL